MRDSCTRTTPCFGRLVGFPRVARPPRNRPASIAFLPAVKKMSVAVGVEMPTGRSKHNCATCEAQRAGWACKAPEIMLNLIWRLGSAAWFGRKPSSKEMRSKPPMTPARKEPNFLVQLETKIAFPTLIDDGIIHGASCRAHSNESVNTMVAVCHAPYSGILSSRLCIWPMLAIEFMRNPERSVSVASRPRLVPRAVHFVAVTNVRTVAHPSHRISAAGESNRIE